MVKPTIRKIRVKEFYNFQTTYSSTAQTKDPKIQSYWARFWESRFHGSVASAPANFQDRAVIPCTSCISSLNVEQEQDSRDSSVGVRMGASSALHAVCGGM